MALLEVNDLHTSFYTDASLKIYKKYTNIQCKMNKIQ